MKRTLLSAIALPLMTSMSFAQSYTDLNLRVYDPSVDQAQSVAEHPQTGASLLRAEGDTIWYDDFADLSNWTLGTTGALGTADSLWEHTTDGPYGTFSGSWGDVQSVTASNGWVMFDSDGNGSADPNTGAPTGVEFDTYIQLATPLDFSGNPVVAVVFTEFYKALSSETYLDVSTDGSNWTSYELHAGFSPNDATAQDEILYQDISSDAGGQSQVWIRLRYVGFGYFWQVDDLMFVEGVENDIALTRLFTGNNEVDYLYTKKPLSQMTDMELGVVATNQGGLAQSNVIVDWEISDGTSVVASGTETITASLAAGTSDTLFFSTNYTPTTVGTYTINMTISSDQTEADISDNDATDSIEVTDFVWGHDYDSEPYVEYGYDASSQNGADGFEMGADYFCQVDGDFIYALQFALGNSTTSASVTAKVYEDDPANGPISETVYDIQPGDLSSGTNADFITVVLDDPVEMVSGSVYTVTVAIEAGDDGYIMGNAIDDDDRGQSVYFAFEDTWYYWSGLTTSMRINTDASIGIEDDVEQFGFGIYPNPTSDNLRFSFRPESAIEQISIVDVNGKLVLSQAINTTTGRLNLDVSSLGSGIYFVNGITENGISSQKLIIQ